MEVFCQNLIISKIEFERNMRVMDNAGIGLSVKRELAQNRDESDRSVRLDATVVVGEKNKTSFYCKMSLILILTWTGDAENFEQEMVHLGTPYIMSFARVKVYELCQQAGVKPVYLPEL